MIVPFCLIIGLSQVTIVFLIYIKALVLEFHFFYVSSLGLKFVSVVSLGNIFFRYSVKMDLNHNMS